MDIETVFEYVQSKFGNFDFLVGFVAGYLGHMVFRRWVYRKIRKVI